MIFWITLGVLLVGFFLILLSEKISSYEGEMLCFGTGYTFVMISAIAGLIMLIIIVVANTNPEAQLSAKQMRYESLVYQLENDFYDNDNDRGKFELMQEAADWNADLAYHRRVQDDFWVGIFYPDIYHELEFIELDDYN